MGSGRGDLCFRCEGAGYILADFGRTKIPCPMCHDETRWLETSLTILLVILLLVLSLYTISLQPV